MLSSTAEPTLTKVHEDSRGEMYAINLPGERELMLLFSKKGSLRGGHSHTVAESIMILDGCLRYHLLTSPRQDLHAGDCISHPAGKVHMGEFLEDTWLLEWKIGTRKGEWSNIDYEPYRALVRANAGR